MKQTSVLISFYLSVLWYTSLPDRDNLFVVVFFYITTTFNKTTKNFLVSSISPNSNLPLDCIIGDNKGFLLICLKEVLVQLACLNQGPSMLHPFLTGDIL